MLPEFHQRMRQLFDQALERPESEQLAFVKRACGDDTTLYDAVERLLRARGESQSFLDHTRSQTTQVGRYLIRGELGHGAMGIVYDAIDPMIGRRVAVKLISLKAGMDPSEAEFMKERLFREARSAGQLFHPGIVVILDVGLHEGSAFITMELVEGPSLQQLIGSGGALDRKTAISIIKQTAAALDYAHQHGVVHRDIKPANIMLQNKVTVKVADFGIAKLMSTQNPTITGMLMGTPSYMSPEQVEARAVDGRSDQFSLAVVAFELLTGSRPFQADTMPTVAHLIVYGPRPSARSLNRALAPQVDDVLERALNRFSEKRFASCTEFATALEQAAASARDETLETATIVHSKLRAPQIKYRRFVIAAAAVVMMVGLTATAIYLNRGASTSVAKSNAPAAAQIANTNPNVVPSAVPKPSPLKPATAVDAGDHAAMEIRPQTNAKPAADAKSSTLPDSVRAQELLEVALRKRAEGDQQKAMDFLQQAAQLGSSTAMEELGESYISGDSKDGVEAMRWFLRAQALGNSDAMVSLGAMYQLGDLVPTSYEDAARWYQRAADLNNKAAMYDLATLYESGRGVARNMDKALELYRQSAALGDAEAQRRLAELAAAKK